MKWWIVRLKNKNDVVSSGVCFLFEFRAEATDFLIECMDNSASMDNHFEIYQGEEDEGND